MAARLLLIPLLALSALLAPVCQAGVVGIYIHQHWPYNHPYAARTWSLEDWRGWIDGLKRLGFKAVMIWPVLETMPEPLTPGDRAAQRVALWQPGKIS
jgi:hypothetical protein